MKLSDVFNSKAIAYAATEVASNKQAYLGTGLFPSKKKAGLDLKWIKTNKGLPVSLAPSNFDAVSTIRSREGFTFTETEMAFFRESMLLKEVDRQEILRVKESTDPYAQAVIEKVFDDATTLVDAADVVPERMRMSLLTPSNGSPSISISANGVTYAYNYDPDGTYAANNYLALSGTAVWTDATNCDPLANIQYGIDAIESKTGARPKYLIVNGTTMKNLRASSKIKALVILPNGQTKAGITDNDVKAVIANELDITVIVYTKQYKTEAGVAQKFFPDGFATLVPEGALGSTWYGTTPEEADLVSGANVDTTVVNTGVSVTVVTTNDPVNTKTTVSEICLPSYERMDETFVIKAF